MTNFISNYFEFDKFETNFKTEVSAGLTTYLTMAYIICINPSLLSKAGIPFEGALFATCFSAAIATATMALLAKYPFALAPGMGTNAYFTFTVCLGFGLKWQEALAAVFISGVLFLILSLLKFREKIMESIPECLRYATSVGIGFLITFVGLKETQIIVSNPDTYVTLGSLTDDYVLVSITGLLLMVFFVVKNIKGGLLLGILITTCISISFGFSHIPGEIFKIPDVKSSLLALDFRGILSFGLLNIIFTFFFVDLFDTVGTVLGVSQQGGYLDNKGRLPRLKRVFISDAVGTIAGALTGTSTVTTYIESASGIASGGRTGLTSLVVSALFFMSLFLSPLVSIIPSSATFPALIIIGCLMLRNISKIDWNDLTEAFPAFITIMMMPLTFSISNGLIFGFISYTVVKSFSGRWREVSWMVLLLSIIFILKIWFVRNG